MKYRKLLSLLKELRKIQGQLSDKAYELQLCGEYKASTRLRRSAREIDEAIGFLSHPSDGDDEAILRLHIEDELAKIPESLLHK